MVNDARKKYLLALATGYNQDDISGWVLAVAKRYAECAHSEKYDRLLANVEASPTDLGAVVALSQLRFTVKDIQGESLDQFIEIVRFVRPDLVSQQVIALLAYHQI